MVTHSLVKRKKPSFLRKDWHKKIKLGSTVKKKRTWRAAKGRHNKIRLGIKGHSRRPKIGWGSNNLLRGLIRGRKVVRIEHIKDLENLSKEYSIMIAHVGRRKRESIISKAKELNIPIIIKPEKRKSQ